MRVGLTKKSRLFACAALAVAQLVSAGCARDSYAAKGAAQGATGGALAGAAGGMMTALIFGGNVAEAGARGAVYGGTVGAVSGGVAGAQRDKQVAAREQAQREREIAEFKAKVGTDAFNGVVALAECKHAIALANAAEARKSSNRDFALAGLWLETLTEADRNDAAAARERFPQLIEKDRELKTDADAESRLAEALEGIREVRAENGLPATCPG